MPYQIKRYCSILVLGFCFSAINHAYAQHLFEQKFNIKEEAEQGNTSTKPLSDDLMPIIKSDTVWQLSGINTSTQSKLIIIEIGQNRAPYAHRINQERGVLPGAFSIQLYPFGFKTSKGDKLSFNPQTRLKIFTMDQDEAIQEFQLTQLNKEPSNALYAYDFGPENQAVWQGFSSITPTHPILRQNLKSQKPEAFSRLSLDPLIRDGISGITSVKLPLPEGQWRLHLWTEDVGYWQTLPEQIERRIRINGEDRDYQLNPPLPWVKNRYTQNKYRLSQFNSLNNLTSWRAIGQYRGDHKQFLIKAKNGEVHIELAGANNIATSLTGLMIERADQHLLADITFQRALWFNGRWPLLPLKSDKNTPPNSKTYRFSPDTPLFISLTLDKSIQLNHLDWQKTPFIIEKRLLLKQLERSLGDYQANPAGSFLAIKPTLLSANEDNGQASKQLHLTIKAPKDLAPGKYPLTIFNNQDKRIQQQLNLELLGTRLPKLTKPVGIYLDYAPHLFLSYERSPMAEKQLLCDLTSLSSLSLTGVAPPFPLPKNAASIKAYKNRLEHIFALGLQPPFLDYASLKNLRFQFGLDQTSAKLTALSKATQFRDKALAMSVADEPSNADSLGAGLKQMASLVDNSQTQPLTTQATLLKAAHLNHPSDKRWLMALDIALINQGYGVSRQSIQFIRNQGTKVWLYNMSNKRLAAGFFLWKHKLSGYLQWHARMPTADPYDPTDGREDDQQLLPVMSTVCAQNADLHPELIALAQGISDHKWLSWLDKKSLVSIPAFKLRQRLLDKIPNTWKRAEKLTSTQLQTWRNEIEELALSISKVD